ncbi:MAG: hypothetical protein ACP5P4_16025 [Steroidobacteraceae bacterium]
MANTLIHESRRLLLPFDTVVDALIELEIKHGRWPSNAELADVTVHDGEDDRSRSVVLSVRLPNQQPVVERTYTLPLIAAAIVNYCLTMRVPMPRSSSKTIQFLPEGIALLLENTLMLQRRHLEAPPVKVLSAVRDDGPTPVDGAPAGSAAAAEEPFAPLEPEAAEGAAAPPEEAPAAEPAGT